MLKVLKVSGFGINQINKMDVSCFMCGKNIGEDELSFKANVDENLKPCDNGVVVCGDPECRRRYEESLQFCGRPVENYSRITGYYQNVGNYNLGKLQEMKDRRRYNNSELL